MERIRINLHLAKHVSDTLSRVSKEKGLTKAAVVTIALERLVREEEERARATLSQLPGK